MALAAAMSDSEHVCWPPDTAHVDEVWVCPDCGTRYICVFTQPRAEIPNPTRENT